MKASDRAPSLNELQHWFSESMARGQHSAELQEWVIPGGKLQNASEALEIYNRAYAARMTEAMAEFYPVISKILGDERFSMLCRDYFWQYPSQTYNLNDVGKEFSNFIASHPTKTELPFLADLARLECLAAKVFHAPRADSLDPSRQKLELSDTTRFIFEPHLEFFTSEYSVWAIWKSSEMAPVTHEAQHFTLFRNSLGRVQIDQWANWEFTALRRLQMGSAISDMMDDDSLNGLEASDLQAFFQKLFCSGLLSNIL